MHDEFELSFQSHDVDSRTDTNIKPFTSQRFCLIISLAPFAGYWIPALCFFGTVSLLFDFIEHSESPRLIHATYPTKMRPFKILARILLMLSIIDFALAAPVVVKDHEVRVSIVDEAIDGTATSPLRRDSSYKWPADRTNAPLIPRSSNSGQREQVSRQHNLSPRTDSIGSPEQSNPVPPAANNPPSLSPPPDPESPSRSSSPDLLNPSSKLKPLSELMSAPTHDSPPLDGSSQTASEDHYSSNSWVPTDSHYSDSTSSWSWSPQHDIPPANSPGSSPDLLNPNTRMKPLSELMSTPAHDAPPPDGSPQIALSPDESGSASSSSPTPTPTHDSPPEAQIESSSSESYSSSSWVQTDSGSESTSSAPTDSDPTSSPGSSQDHITSRPNLDDDLPSDNHPLPTSPSNPGPSPPPSAKRPRPEDPETLSSLSKFFKGRIMRRFSARKL